MAKGTRSNPKFCHICFKPGHSTQECYFNGRFAGVPNHSSRQEVTGRIKRASSNETCSTEPMSRDQHLQQTSSANTYPEESRYSSGPSNYCDSHTDILNGSTNTLSNNPNCLSTPTLSSNDGINFYLKRLTFLQS